MQKLDLEFDTIANDEKTQGHITLKNKGKADVFLSSSSKELDVSYSNTFEVNTRDLTRIIVNKCNEMQAQIIWEKDEVSLTLCYIDDFGTPVIDFNVITEEYAVDFTLCRDSARKLVNFLQ